MRLLYVRNDQQSIIDEEEWIHISGGELEDENGNSITTVWGLPIITCSVKNFLIIDDRHWYEQMF